MGNPVIVEASSSRTLATALCLLRGQRRSFICNKREVRPKCLLVKKARIYDPSRAKDGCVVPTAHPHAVCRDAVWNLWGESSEWVNLLLGLESASPMLIRPCSLKGPDQEERWGRGRVAVIHRPRAGGRCIYLIVRLVQGAVRDTRVP